MAHGNRGRGTEKTAAPCAANSHHQFRRDSHNLDGADGLALDTSLTYTGHQSMGHVIYYLCAYPQYAKPLREEVEQVIATDGWNKAAMSKLRKCDSFIKEVQRLEGLGAGVSPRLISYQLCHSISHLLFSCDGPHSYQTIHVFQRGDLARRNDYDMHHKEGPSGR